jgi:hypothetical protein
MLAEKSGFFIGRVVLEIEFGSKVVPGDSRY